METRFPRVGRPPSPVTIDQFVSLACCSRLRQERPQRDRMLGGPVGPRWRVGARTAQTRRTRQGRPVGPGATGEVAEQLSARPSLNLDPGVRCARRIRIVAFMCASGTDRRVWTGGAVAIARPPWSRVPSRRPQPKCAPSSRKAPLHGAFPMRPRGLEPPRAKRSQGPQPCASTNSATGAEASEYRHCLIPSGAGAMFHEHLFGSVGAA